MSMNTNGEISQYSLKYRPRQWDQVYGQDAIVKDLRERVIKKDIPSAILFQGPFGCGKTTLCELFAAAIQSSDENGNPNWNEPACKSILKGTFDRDTIRLDGAQLSGKSDIVEFTRDLNTRPLFDSRKILIIEECDQISSAGISSLLKILEGLKPWVTVILLSMEDKISGAIKSRCQVYKIKPLGIKDIMLNLKYIMEQTGAWKDENIPNSFRLEGLQCIAGAAQGSMRSAVQYLEQCINCEAWTPTQIDDLLGIIDEEKTWKILDGLLVKTKDESIWKTILHIKTGDESNHFINYMSMLLSECVVYKETGITYDESGKWRFDKMLQSPYVEDLFYCITCHPQMNKPYIRNTDILSCLMAYYQGINFKPGGTIVADAFKSGISCGPEVVRTPSAGDFTTKEPITIGTPEIPKILKDVESPDDIPIRKPKTNIENLNIVF